MHVWSPRQHLIDNLIDLVSIKAGLTLSEGKAIEFLNDLTEGWWLGDKEEVIRIDMLDFEQAFIHLMYKVGALNDEDDLSRVVIKFVEYNLDRLSIDEKDVMAKIKAVSILQHHLVENALDKKDLPDEYLSIPLIDKLVRDFKDRYVFHNEIPESVDWDRSLPLDALFDTEEIPNSNNPDCYFDQRYIDYLARQKDEIGDIHWRQFEYLTGEYFRKNGYEVEVTTGRGDGGIDVIAKKDDPISGPQMILVQCKKYSDHNPVQVDSVRAFWATVDDAGATKGIVATTSRLTSGAHDYCKAKLYRLDSAEKSKIEAWVQTMSSSYNKAFQLTQSLTRPLR